MFGGSGIDYTIPHEAFVKLYVRFSEEYNYWNNNNNLVFRAMPSPGPGMTWFEIDKLLFDEQFFQYCRFWHLG